MPHLILIRHGQTDWNSDHRFQGTTDVPLNDHGRAQAFALAAQLADETLGYAFSSDLSRAWETGSIVTDCHDVELVPEARLRETSFGQWEGLRGSQVMETYPELIRSWRSNPFVTTPPGGEPLSEAISRVESLLADLRQLPDDATVLLSAHGAIHRTLICAAIGLPHANRWNLSLRETSVSRIDLTPTRAVLNLLNDTRHLDRIAALNA